MKTAQEARAKQLKVPVEIVNAVGMKLRLIPAGEYMRGSADSDQETEKPQHRVRIMKDFYLGAHEVTQGQWKAVMESEPWKGRTYGEEGKDYAATYVSWTDAEEFCGKLSRKDGRKYRLPTEAEWEYACRGGTATRYSFGDDESKLGDFAWYDKNADDAREQYAHPVGLKKANGFGLFDMHGNASEWCADWHEAKEYQQYAGRTAVAPQGPPSGTSRANRGGSWFYGSALCQSAYRDGHSPGFRGYYIGFRVAAAPSVK